MLHEVISIVMPLRSSAATLHVELDRILAQTRQDWELVSVDDGSSNGTAENIDVDPKKAGRHRDGRRVVMADTLPVRGSAFVLAKPKVPGQLNHPKRCGASLPTAVQGAPRYGVRWQSATATPLWILHEAQGTGAA
jgi:hypothetical protein